MTDFRKLCKELVQAWDEHGGCGIPYHEACWSLAVDKVRKVLDEVVEEGPTLKEVSEFIDNVAPKSWNFGAQHHDIMRIVLAVLNRWGRSNVPLEPEPSQIVARLSDDELDHIYYNLNPTEIDRCWRDYARIVIAADRARCSRRKSDVQ